MWWVCYFPLPQSDVERFFSSFLRHSLTGMFRREPCIYIFIKLKTTAATLRIWCCVSYSWYFDHAYYGYIVECPAIHTPRQRRCTLLHMDGGQLHKPTEEILKYRVCSYTPRCRSPVEDIKRTWYPTAGICLPRSIYVPGVVQLWKKQKLECFLAFLLCVSAYCSHHREISDASWSVLLLSRHEMPACM